MSDKIVYLIVTNGGGMDGMDRADKGGKIMFATYNKAVAEKKVGPWSHIEPKVVDTLNTAEKALKKLDPLDILSINSHHTLLYSKEL